MNPNQPEKIIVAGPCSAESRNQVMKTAEALSAGGVEIFRAGVWKPRTRPGCFEGVGTEALEWLAEVRQQYGMRVATELNTARNAEQLLKYGVDIAWIGARTAANPFDVQDIADALRGCDIDVYIKNPICPDQSLWLGDIERLERAGVRRIVAVHRGFCTWNQDIYRNDPIWTIPLWLKAQRPDMPVICDPSHISGRSDLVPILSQTALELGLDGLMVESHCCPEKALSDAAQQLTPDEVCRMFRSLGILRIR